MADLPPVRAIQLSPSTRFRGGVLPGQMVEEGDLVILQRPVVHDDEADGEFPLGLRDIGGSRPVGPDDVVYVVAVRSERCADGVGGRSPAR